MSRLRSLATLLPFFLSACSTAKMPMLNPNGYVGESELDLLKITTLIMAVIVVPLIIGLFWIVWTYRSSTEHDDFDPEFDHSPLLHKITLYVPLITITALGALTWVYTHRLDPYRPVKADETPYEIQAISLDYKWLFIYPEEGIATVNELAAPVGRPVTIRVTSDPMMTSIFIPGLISQIYAMPGMETRANFLADKAEQMEGANAMYSGPGFSTQRFTTHLLSDDDFDAWLTGVRDGTGGSGDEKAKTEQKLDFDRYAKMVPVTKSEPVTHFTSVDPGLFQKVIQKYMPHYMMSDLPTTAEYDKGE